MLSYICHVVDAPDFCNGIGCDPVPRCDEYLENRRTFVTYYLIPKRMWKEAADVLGDIISSDIGYEFPLYNAFAQQKPRDLLGEIKKYL